MTERFADKVALITGAGSGMGRAITIRLAEEGASVFAVDVDGDGLRETVARASGKVASFQADLSDPGTCADVVAACVEQFGGLDVLGNVAGILLAAHITDVTLEQYRKVMAVNLDACFFLSQAAIPHLLERNGNIVNIASNAGLHGVPYCTVYAMSKGGLIQLTRSLAMEFIKKPLRVNAIAPAGTRTPITATAQFPEDIEPSLLHRLAGHRGMAEPEEVAGLFAFLASEDGRSITGAIYALDNGLTAG